MQVTRVLLAHWHYWQPLGQQPQLPWAKVMELVPTSSRGGAAFEWHIWAYAVGRSFWEAPEVKTTKMWTCLTGNSSTQFQHLLPQAKAFPSSYIPQARAAHLISLLNSPGLISSHASAPEYMRISGIRESQLEQYLVIQKIKYTSSNKQKSNKRNKIKQYKNDVPGSEKPHEYYCKGKHIAISQTGHFQSCHKISMDMLLYLGFLWAVLLVTLWTFPAIWQFLVKQPFSIHL
jgi:hypothetical protein